MLHCIVNHHRRALAYTTLGTPHYTAPCCNWPPESAYWAGEISPLQAIIWALRITIHHGVLDSLTRRDQAPGGSLLGTMLLVLGATDTADCSPQTRRLSRSENTSRATHTTHHPHGRPEPIDRPLRSLALDAAVAK